MRRSLSLLSLLLLAACSDKAAEQAQQVQNGREAVRLFAEACVNTRGDAAVVTAWAQQQGWPLLDAAAQAKLPAGMMELDASGVWQAAEAAFYLSLSPNACSLKAAQADETSVRTQFTALAEAGEAGMTARLRADHHSPSPFPFSQLVYGWQPDGAAEEWLLRANTSPSKYVPAQAALNFSREALPLRPAINP